MTATLINYVNKTSTTLCQDLLPLAITGVTVYLLMIGFSIMRGEAEDSVYTLISKWLRITIIAGIALSAGTYQTFVIGAANGLEVALVKALSGKDTVGILIDDFAEPFEVLGSQIWNEAVNEALPNLSLCAAAALVALAEFFIIPISIGIYLLAKVAFHLTLAIGPAFILCAMWPATEKYTESWIGQLVNYVILKALIAGCLGMLLFFARDYAEHLANKKDMVNILTACVTLMISCIALGIVLLNLPQIASALAGGASLAGIGKHVGRSLMDLLKKKDQPNQKGGEISPGGNGRGGRTGASKGQPIAAPPLYNRNAISKLNRK
ncbi:MAG: type IV secretion system protein [Pseudomonadota bacterium]